MVREPVKISSIKMAYLIISCFYRLQLYLIGSRLSMFANKKTNKKTQPSSNPTREVFFSTTVCKYKVTSYTWPCFSGTFQKVTCPVYTCTVAYTKILSFTMYQKNMVMFNWSSCNIFHFTKTQIYFHGELLIGYAWSFSFFHRWRHPRGTIKW